MCTTDAYPLYYRLQRLLHYRGPHFALQKATLCTTYPLSYPCSTGAYSLLFKCQPFVLQRSTLCIIETYHLLYIGLLCANIVIIETPLYYRGLPLLQMPTLCTTETYPLHHRDLPFAPQRSTLCSTWPDFVQIYSDYTLVLLRPTLCARYPCLVHIPKQLHTPSQSAPTTSE